MANIELQNKINKLPKEITELFTLLITEEEDFNNLFVDNEEFNTSLLEKNKDFFFSQALKLALEIDTLKIFEKSLLDIGFSERDVSILTRNTLENFISLIKEIKNDLALAEIENKETETIAQQNSISHIDILNEIENPTPSINTTTLFQNSNPTKTPMPVPKNTPNQSTAPSLHSPAPVAPYTNPALKIATKLEQNLGAPSASIPKDVYVSKKPDPYHEPVL